MKSLGINAADIDTHLIRKGAAAYVSSGSISGLSASAVHVRAGYRLRLILNKNFQAHALI